MVIPLISVHEDTFATIEKIETALGKIGIREENKVAGIREIMKDFDEVRLLRKLNIKAAECPGPAGNRPLMYNRRA